MLGFDKYFENKTLLYSAGAVAFLVAALLILFIFRLAFGRRLHMPGGGRARQPRLGVVDAFDLDRQRQLVLVRRDNVEHLVMIGGPNDVLIESQIVRAEARDVPRSRDKEPVVAPVTVAPLSWPAGGSPATALPPSIPSEPKLLPDEMVAAREITKETSPKEAPADAAPAIAAPVKAPSPISAPPAPRPPFLPLPPRRPITTPSFNFKPLSPRPPAGEPAIGPLAEGVQAPSGLPPAPRPPGASPSSPASPSAPASASVSAPASVGAPALRPLRPAPPPSPLAPPVTPAQPIETVASTAPAIVSPQEPEPENAPATTDALESLEEEMAKLLGRGTKEP